MLSRSSTNDKSTIIIQKGPFNPEDIADAENPDDYYDSIAIDGI